ncbi:MAG: DsrE family protein [Gammaproteobacteria bacterium]|nr:DsrE family protein [Gammaproteobacteria bacterium]
MVLNVASNLLKHYGQDKVDVEIVAFGPGLRLMFKDNANSARIEGLTTSGVRFAACGNTLTKMTKALGRAPELHSSAGIVPGGAVRIIDLQNQGYKVLKP